MLQNPVQADQVEGIVLDAVVFRMLKRMGVYSQQVDSTIGRVAIFQRHDLAEKLKAARRTARHHCAAVSTVFRLHPSSLILSDPCPAPPSAFRISGWSNLVLSVIDPPSLNDKARENG
jgi:hypothetical protein